ncbi:Similar to Uncharacterized ATP-dependent helicase C582.10c; acc. no. Q10332 [Pyronema omphalodes CBS 100304]|uniref:Similar to Uncharacterized ATP-dependent helicase C582.10c acc. no. Q10332 n=1 Tax=Pyronema omphalodes (strain CBS 100304) TaxID=1076935 RepID=U4LJ90_PYROM|nr:Similar to Uncharacterized ATP-dependent helicase C582.10c; acc. no. Q10332 [Pyronema omphalodes CBS 100304]
MIDLTDSPEAVRSRPPVTQRPGVPQGPYIPRNTLSSSTAPVFGAPTVLGSNIRSPETIRVPVDLPTFGNPLERPQFHTGWATVNRAPAPAPAPAFTHTQFNSFKSVPTTQSYEDPISERDVQSSLQDLFKGMSIKEQQEEEEKVNAGENNRVPGLKLTLLPHQVNGLKFLQDKEEDKVKGGILADDMGLGKTIQSIALILSRPHPKYPIGSEIAFEDMPEEYKEKAAEIPKEVKKGTLVIAPLGLIKQWESELVTHISSSHSLRILVHHGPSRTQDPRVLRRYDVVITTYDTIRSEHTNSTESSPIGCFGLHWWRIICDEAHTIKNKSAKVTQACYALDAQYRWCLTGTPIQNNLDELYSLFRFLRIKPFCEFAAWKDMIARPMQQGKTKIAMERLRGVLGLMMLRRTKEILKASKQITMPDRKMEKVEAEFGGEEKAFYTGLEERSDEALKKLMKQSGGKNSAEMTTKTLVLLLRLRQACNHPSLLTGGIQGADFVLPTGAKKVKPEDEDELTALMGGVTLESTNCEVCLVELNEDQRRNRALRCDACDASIKNVERGLGSKKAKSAKPSVAAPKTEAPRRRGRKVVLDSDDEEEEEATPEPELETEEEPAPADDDADDSDDYDYEEGDGPRLVPSTKIKALLKILLKEKKERNKTIVFSDWPSFFDLIEPFLLQKGIAFTRYDGKMKNDHREASLRRLRGVGEFEGKEWCGVLLCSLRCGALGLNLTCASRVVILEPYWNPFIEEQAIDRVHRIGQTSDVVIYKLTIVNSVEERILKLQDAKRMLSKAAIGDGAISKKKAKLGFEDLMFLFNRAAEHGDSTEEPGIRYGKTKVLKETRPSPRPMPEPPRAQLGGGIREQYLGGTQVLPPRERIRTPEEVAERERRRAAERDSVYSRR